MPEKSLTIAAYAAGASLAAATLVYVFGPTIFLDQDGASRNTKKAIVGLSNPANDCFINSILQALAGLPSLRLYLIREVHRRQVGELAIYSTPCRPPLGSKDYSRFKDKADWLLVSLQQGRITHALKEMLDALNERPLHRKTISAQRFIQAIEQAFRTRVSKHQQDAQEFLQIVMERLADEYHAGEACRKYREPSQNKLEAVSEQQPVQAEEMLEKTAVSDDESGGTIAEKNGDTISAEKTPQNDEPYRQPAAPRNDEIPFEGSLESQIECSHCHFTPKPSISKFVILTLNVPQELTSTSLDACFDGILKIEHIDGFKCDKCRLTFALESNAKQLARPGLSDSDRIAMEHTRQLLQDALEQDPESPPSQLQLGKIAAPQRRITKHMRLSTFPRVLAIHLSRSVWTGFSSSAKNMAKVKFPELLTLGGLLDRKQYQLLSLVTHKGGHNSGHYETFRRQVLPPPAVAVKNADTLASVFSDLAIGEKTAQGDKPNATEGRPSIDARPQSDSAVKISGEHKKRKVQDRWWRISDDKVKDCKTSDILSMQREVYLLFYELVETQ